MERVTAAILSGAPQYSAADTFDAFTKLNELKAAARVEMAKVDFLVVPSAAHHYTIAGEAFPAPHCKHGSSFACLRVSSAGVACSGKRDR